MGIVPLNVLLSDVLENEGKLNVSVLRSFSSVGTWMSSTVQEIHAYMYIQQ